MMSSQHSTFSGTLEIKIEEASHPDANQSEILVYSDQYDAYEVLHDDDTRLWFKEDMVIETVMDEWNAFVTKSRKVAKETTLLAKKKLDTVSEESELIIWGNSKPHKLAMLKDGYLANGGYDKYPPRAKKNGYNIPLMASWALGIRINTRSPMPLATAGMRPQPSAKVQAELRTAISTAFERLPPEEQPKAKAAAGMMDDFGQRKVNLDNPAHDFLHTHSYNRLYLRTVPAMSQRQSRNADAEGKRHLSRYEDEIKCCEPFIGIELGRREIMGDGPSYLNWMESEVQKFAAELAGVEPEQRNDPACGFMVTSEDHNFLKVIACFYCLLV